MARRDGALRMQAEEHTMTTSATQPLFPAVPADTGPAAPIAHTLSLVLPAHNEEGNLEWVVREALAVLPLIFRDCEIVVVDDGSRDATPAIADTLAAADARVRVIHHPRNQGYGAALRSGFAAARGDRIMFMDADRQFDIREVAKLAPWVDEYAIVVGYRLRRRDPWRRVALGATFNVLVKVLFGVRVRDIDCGFKIFRAELLWALDLQAPGALINTEILALARQQGAAMVEIGVNHYPRPAGEQSGGSPRVVLRALDEMLRLWWRLRSARGAPGAAARRVRAEAGEQPR
jgi:glycosyltransferase involved in cell wall biosynthesis